MTDPKHRHGPEEPGQDRASAEPEAAAGDAPEPAQEEHDTGPEQALSAARQEIAELKEAVLRMRAEMDNLRKRLIRDLERSQRRSLEAIMSDLLPVRDSLERGVEAADESASVDALREGKTLTMKMLSKVLEDHGLEEINPQGEVFDPELHEAMTMQPAEQPVNTVLEVVQKGYRLHDRLIRPARVVVSAGPKSD